MERWGDVLVTSDPMRHGSSRAASKRARRSACGSLWIDCAQGRGSVGVEAEPRWGVSADVNPELAETLAFGGDDDPGQTSHAALSSGRVLRGTA